MLVSVIIPAYNAARYLPSAIQSVIAQTEQDFEIIVVDDCSTDETADVAAALAERDGRIRLIRQSRNGGPGAARNTAIAAARGCWIALLDADDTFSSDRLEVLLDLAGRTAADMVSDNLILHREDGSEPDCAMYSAERLPRERQLSTTDFVLENTRSDAGVRSSFGFMQPLIRTDFLAETEIRYDSQTRFGEDYIFYVRCLTKGARWWVTPKPLYVYTVRQASLTEAVSPQDLKVISVMEQELLGAAVRAGSTRLVAALRRHKRKIDHWRHTMGFKAALERGAFRDAAKIAFESRESLRAILRDTAANAVQRVYRF